MFTLKTWVYKLSLRTENSSKIIAQQIFYENMPIQIYWKFYHQRMKIFRLKSLTFFIFLLKNIDCGHSLESPRWGGYNEYPQTMFFEQK